jgi:DNA-binding MarR family transcriptional regulator
MLEFDFDQSVGYWVFAATQDISRVMNDELAAHGITQRQWETLAWVARHGEISQGELAECMSIEAPTLVGVLDRMERDGWIQRVPAESDRRKKLIRATERVEPLWAMMVECAHRVRARATEGLSPEQIIQLRDLLTHIRMNLGGKVDELTPTNVPVEQH